MANLRSDLEARLSTIDDVMVSESMFGGGDAFWVNGKEIAHFHDAAVIEVRLTRAAIRERRAEFKADERVELRPSGADWMTVCFKTPVDVAFVFELVSIAARVHRPADGATANPPPSGAALERRKRFH